MSHTFEVGDHVEYKGYNDLTFTGVAFGVVVKTTSTSVYIRTTKHITIPEMVGRIASKFPRNVILVQKVVSKHTIRELMS